MIFSLPLFADEPHQKIEFLGKIHLQGSGLEISPEGRKEILPAHLSEASLSEVLADMTDGEDAIITGYVSYAPYPLEGETKLRPIFIVESIRPVSFGRLHRIAGPYQLERDWQKDAPAEYAPASLPVSAEVASALTVTTSLLMLQSLTTPQGTPETEQRLNQGLLLFSGAVATGVFIYQQLKHKKDHL